MKQRIILDTDMGTDVDDALCLALALASPEFELVAVTTVSGDTDLRARITRKLLDLAGRDDIPVFSGCGEHLEGSGSFALTGDEGKGILDEEEDLHIEPETAVDAMARLLEENPDLEVVAVGPMTNLATLIRTHPAAASRIRQLTIMGGHVREIRYGGFSFPPGVDYNLCSDAPASIETLRAEIPTRLVTGDVTLQTWMRKEDLERIESCDRPLQRALGRAIRLWTPTQNTIFSGMGAAMDADNVAFLHDPLALACVADESFCTFEELNIEACVQDGVFRSLEQPTATQNSRKMRVATAVDPETFRDHFVQRLAQLGA